MPHDQTDHESLKFIHADLKAAGAAAGTGVFLLPDPESGIGKFKKAVVPNITYAEVAARGANCTSFAWVAPHVKAHDQIKAAGCFGACWGSCPTPGCMCTSPGPSTGQCL